MAVLAVTILVPRSSSFAQQMPAPPKENSLYNRIGGYDVISNLVDDFIHQLGEDPAFKRFGGGRSKSSLVATRQLVIENICNLAGGPCAYIGRDLKTAHAGLAITQEEWDFSMKKWKVSLDKFKVPEPVQKEFLALIEKTKPDIVEKPKGDYQQGDKAMKQN
jgi:hemoglobin